MVDLTDDFPQNPDTPGRLDLFAPQRGRFERGYDGDWFAITLDAGQRYLFSLESTTGISLPEIGNAVYALAVYDAAGNRLTRILNGDYLHGPTIEFVAPAAGTYYVEAISLYKWYGLEGYELKAALRTGADDQPAGSATSAFLPRDGSVTGSFEVAGDIDWVRFSVQPGVHYRFEFEGPGIGTGSPYVFPTEIRILDAAGRFVQYLDWGFSPAQAGDYFLELRGLQAGTFKGISQTWQDDYLPSNATLGSIAPGALATGTIEFEHDVDRFRLDVEEGVFYTLTFNAEPDAYMLFLRDAAGTIRDSASGNIDGRTMSFDFRAGAGDSHFLDVEQGPTVRGLLEPRSYMASLSPGRRDLVGDTIATAQAVPIGVSTRGVLEAASDVDMYRVSLVAGEPYAMTVGAQTGRAEGFVLRILGADGATLAVDDGWDDRNYSLALDFTPTLSGEYYLQLKSAMGGVHPYTLAVLPLRGDTVGPALLGSTHPAGADGVALTDTTIVLRFSEPVAIDKSNITITGPNGAVVYQASDNDYLSMDFPLVQGSEVLLRASAHFTPGSYTIHLPQGAVSDLAGNPYAGPDSMRFSTVAPAGAATSGNDLLAGLPGQRTDGGAGIDTLLLPGAAGNYLIQRNGQEATTQHDLWDTRYDVVNVERLLFEYGAIALDIDGNGGQAYRLYRAAFDRAPDLEGLGFWIAQLDRGSSLLDAARGFIGSAEFAGLYGTAPDDQLFVRLLYQNVLQREPDAAGAAFWLARLGDGQGREQVLVSFSESAENVAATLDLIGNGFQYTPY
ncbi:DUF4214 domain-containing protein [Massilia sp. MS-15]|uniref:DUF4214 domain-containing protein n=1 Tax=Massilia sp. MS-15 TaxID=2878200 RepID=UPI001CD2894A|nr:DUF4214 domain-containing protein [Massilia sp. MS-15]MCA1247166.1 DUF4214 domain-containing protein [Massilia sp. MS-15]